MRANDVASNPLSVKPNPTICHHTIIIGSLNFMKKPSNEEALSLPLQILEHFSYFAIFGLFRSRSMACMWHVSRDPTTLNTVLVQVKFKS